jgi:predicted house-cleaning noncanonical NTP pyrophosphatase (MazG superfamily)
MPQEHHKLVRDGIPELIRRAGAHCEVAVIVAEEEYRQALRAKLIEEATEAAQAETTEALITELADLQEVLDALRAAYVLSQEAIRQEQAQRRAERGGFERRLLLLWTT